MDRRAIGIFDSGLGGLTAASELSRLLPNEDIIYFGDTGRVPYGTRSQETILKYARQDVSFLRSFDLKAIAIACGTVSTVAIRELKGENDIPLVGVLKPTGLAAAAATSNKKVGLIATRASVQSGAYEEIIAAADPEIEVISRACPLLVPLIEDGRIRAGDLVIETVVSEYLAPMKEAGVDTLVLGCTHYPLLTEIISRQMGEHVTLINTGEQCALRMAEILEEQELFTGETGRGSRRFFVSDAPEGFIRTASLFLGEELRDPIERVDIDRYE